MNDYQAGVVIGMIMTVILFVLYYKFFKFIQEMTA